MDQFDTALVLTRVLTSGVVMSIEKNDKELPALSRWLTRQSGRAHAVLVNSRTAAIHAALCGQGIGHGDAAALPELDPAAERFVSWLGVRRTDGTDPAFALLSLTPENAAEFAGAARRQTAPALAVDLTGLGFGPAAAMLTDDERIWARAERLKIFGAFDLRTMWTQEEAEPGLAPGVQFNYRLSPLVAACVRMALAQAGSRTPAVTGGNPR
ncbi:degT/DnrJ/EryC1/StrS aminotransferase [Catenuloplanes atrovinosus]|uniref:dTDP-4-amino-4,6-dideoxygalactose transaminase n=1 Tax=Catenuloplanes atrovinosus TaxID=137266 RepID=A0AAE3YPD7_9ACTN|nr:degT/DnrJ/EryC1/StrS aminotransferase [Catenuloplanes atrovinosus]MDR7275436.1 dTDP-4-amino-4,6-dideoxygalactose transaminase [Catenuloplanes atrovinosus]